MESNGLNTSLSYKACVVDTHFQTKACTVDSKLSLDVICPFLLVDVWFFHGDFVTLSFALLNRLTLNVEVHLWIVRIGVHSEALDT